MKKLFTFIFLVSFSATFAQVEGTWKMSYQAAALGVGPALGDISWWSNSEDDLTLRSCYFNDQYVFDPDGTFSNVQDDESWIEEWQGMEPPGCAAPVAPHDGSNAATWTYDDVAGTVTLDGVGAYIGLAKVYNGGELSAPGEAPASITYPVEFSGEGDTMTINIDFGGGFWRFILAKEGSSGIYDGKIVQTQITPNPASTVIYLENSKDFEEVAIYSINGQLIYKSDQVSGSISVENFAPGIYTLRAIGASGKQYHAKFTVQ
jgi:hypothetical protein